MKRVRAAAFPIGVVVLGACGLIFLGLRFANPDMTDTRLFLTFWPVLVPAVAGFGLVVWSVEGWR